MIIAIWIGTENCFLLVYFFADVNNFGDQSDLKYTLAPPPLPYMVRLQEIYGVLENPENFRQKNPKHDHIRWRRGANQRGVLFNMVHRPSKMWCPGGKNKVATSQGSSADGHVYETFIRLSTSYKWKIKHLCCQQISKSPNKSTAFHPFPFNTFSFSSHMKYV